MAGMGPDSFALDDSSGVVLQQPSRSASGPQISLQGGGGVGIQAGQASIAPGGEFQQAAAVSGKTLDALNKLTQGMLAPYVAAEQKRLYFEGMSQVVQGRSLQDIEREQPWYTKIFGPSATVQGAQAMTAMTAITQAQNEFMEAMPDLRTKDPNTVRKYLVDQAARIGNTGDRLVDGLVQSKLAEQWGPLLDTHMKQHFAWQQEDMGHRWVNMQVANGKLLQSTLHEQAGYTDPEVMARQVPQLTEGLAKPYGMTDESYAKHLVSAARANMSLGNFEAYTALKNNAEAWNAIPIDARVQLESEEELWSQKRQIKDPALFDALLNQETLSIALTQGSYPGDAAALHADIDRMNADWKRCTGASTDLIDNRKRTHLVKQWYAGRERRDATLQRARNKALDDQAQRAAVLAAFNSGASSILPPEGISAENSQAVMEEVWQEAQSGQDELANFIKKAAMTSDKEALRVPSLVNQMKQDTEMLRAGGPVTGRQLATLNLAQQFLGSGTLGVTALANYVGADSAQFLEYLIRSGTDFNDPKDLETRLAIARGSVGATVTAEERRRSENWLVKQAPGWFKRNLPLFGGPGALTSFELSDESCDGLARDLAPAVARIRKALPGIPYESAIQYAFHAEIGNQNTADFVDGTFVRHNPNVEGSQSFFQGVQAITNHVLSQSNEDYQHVVREEAHDLLRQVLQKQVASLNAEHANDPNYKKADTRNFRIKKDYVAVGGQQLGNGPLMLFYANKQTGQPYQVLLHPTAVRDRYVKYISDTRTKYDKAWKKLKATQIKIVR